MNTYLNTIGAEMLLLAAACLCLLLGVGRSQTARSLAAPCGFIALLAALVLVWRQSLSPALAPPGLVDDAFSSYARLIAVAVGLLIYLVNWHLPADDARGEYFFLLLSSIAGLMLTAAADDLITLFFALELVSVPTYVLIALGSHDIRAPEAAGKYFFLGALAAAVMVYGFSFLYGLSGSTTIGLRDLGTGLAAYVGRNGLTNPYLLAGLALAVGGLCFKIAAAPFHFYVADVYQGAASPITGALGFLPKAAGFIALVRLLSCVGFASADTIFWMLWALAAATMTVGNVLALLQRNVKRILAFSSVSHSGYMLIGLLVGPGAPGAGNPFDDGISAMMFYLAVYGVMNLGAFAVLSFLICRGRPAEDLKDLRGLSRTEPVAAFVLAVCVFSLMGLPPTAGFAGKLYIFSGAFSLPADAPHHTALVVLAVIGVLNAAIGAAYYLRIVAACYLGEETAPLDFVPSSSLRFAVCFCAMIVLLFGLYPKPLITMSTRAASGISATLAAAPHDPPPADLTINVPALVSAHQ